jgi:uncharacterized RDD family membrane protein YckC
MSAWFYHDGTKRVGPVDEAAFMELVANGAVGGDTLVWHQDLPKWMPWQEAAEGMAPKPAPAHSAPAPSSFAPGFAAASPQPRQNAERCSECGRWFGLSDLVRFNNSYVCAFCKPVFLQRLKEGVALPSERNYGGFWIRVGAKSIDGFILLVVNMIIGGVLSVFLPVAHDIVSASSGANLARTIIDLVLQLGTNWGYQIYFLGAHGATLGKMACKIKVINADGSGLTYGMAFKRTLAELVCGITLGIGYLMVAFDEEKRGLHDRICNTRVIRV